MLKIFPGFCRKLGLPLERLIRCLNWAQRTRVFILQIPIVDSELRKAAGENEDENGQPSSPSASSTKVTAHGTYATQSALTATPVVKEEKM